MQMRGVFSAAAGVLEAQSGARGSGEKPRGKEREKRREKQPKAPLALASLRLRQLRPELSLLAPIDGKNSSSSVFSLLLREKLPKLCFSPRPCRGNSPNSLFFPLIFPAQLPNFPFPHPQP